MKPEQTGGGGLRWDPDQELPEAQNRRRLEADFHPLTRGFHLSPAAGVLVPGSRITSRLLFPLILMEWPRKEGENDDQGHPAQSVMDGTRRVDGGLSPTGKDTQKTEC